MSEEILWDNMSNGEVEDFKGAIESSSYFEISGERYIDVRKTKRPYIEGFPVEHGNYASVGYVGPHLKGNCVLASRTEVECFREVHAHLRSLVQEVRGDALRNQNSPS